MSVPALWSEVNRYGQNSDFTRALKTVNKSKCPGGPGCREEDISWVERATPRHSAEGDRCVLRLGPKPGGGSLSHGHRRPELGRLRPRVLPSVPARPGARGRGDLKRPWRPEPLPKMFFVSSPRRDFAKMSD